MEKKNSVTEKTGLFGIGGKMPIQMLVISALMAALSIVLGKYLAINAGEFMRFSFENMPVILTGIAFGPIVAVLVATVADLLGSLMVGYAINPIITLGAAAVGLCSGAIYMILKKVNIHLAFRIAITVFLSHLIGSVTIKTVGLQVMYGVPYHVLFLWRSLNYLIIGALEATLLTLLLGNKALRRALEKAKRARER